MHYYLEWPFYCFSGYVTIITLRSLNDDFTYQGDVAGDLFKLGSGLVAINVFGNAGNVLQIRNIEPPIKIRFGSKVM